MAAADAGDGALTVDRAEAVRLAARHAETARLLGVDFVPVYRAGSVDDEQPEAVAAEQPRSSGEPAGVSERAAEVEAKPAVKPAVKKAATRDMGTKQGRLDELRARYEEEAPHASFVTSFTNIVFGEGDPDARLMFVGEAPGADEDKTGRPFIGRAGQLLEKMIVAMGLSREQVYIANALKTRPPDNRTPTPDEVHACAPYLFEQIAIIEPEVIVTLGLPSTRLLLDSKDSMSRLRGRFSEFPAPGFQGGLIAMPADLKPVAVMPTYHPAYLLRSYTAENRAKVWSDLQMVMDRLGMSPKG